MQRRVAPTAYADLLLVTYCGEIASFGRVSMTAYACVFHPLRNTALVHLLAAALDVSAAAHLGLWHSSHKPETHPAPAATAPVVSHNLSEIFREEKVSRKARGQHAADLNDPLFPLLEPVSASAGPAR